jgi:hypothetical protein
MYFCIPLARTPSTVKTCIIVSKCAAIRTSTFKESNLLAYNSVSLGEWCHVLKEIISCIFKVSLVYHLCAPETLKIDVRSHLLNKAA